MARRVVIFASEDVGCADPQALVVAAAALTATANLGMPEAIYPITEAMGVKIPLISYSGALVLTEEGETLYSLTMKAEQTAAFLEAVIADLKCSRSRSLSSKLSESDMGVPAAEARRAD